MRNIHLIDTSVASDNLGDEIIVSAVEPILRARFPDAYISTSSGHDGLGRWGRELVEQADLVFLMGSNALAARRRTGGRFIWSVRRRDLNPLAHKVVLVGVGANRDRTELTLRQRRFMTRVLSPHHVHSVRDGLARTLVEAAGLRAWNTSCPTLWGYAAEPPSVPAGKAPAVVFTLARHKAQPEDRALVETLVRLYDRVAFWPQQPRDLTYLEEMRGTEGIQVLPANLAAYDQFLASVETDVVGTRLHGSIRGLKHARRVLVIAVDHRAREIGADTGLPVLDRARVPHELEARLTRASPLELHLPQERIEAFLAQF